MQNLQDAQQDMREGYAYGSIGVIVSGLVWLLSCLAMYYYSSQQAIWTLIIGGMFIYPLGTLIEKLMGLKGSHNKDNPLGKLAMEGTIWMIMCIPLAYGLSLIKTEWFFQGMMMIIAGRYLTFASIYGLRLYWGLGALLGLSAYGLFRMGAGDFTSALTCGIIEIIFGMGMYALFRYDKMKSTNIILTAILFTIFTSCSNNRLEEKGFPVNNSEDTTESDGEKPEGISNDSVKFDTRPSNVLLTGITNVRLTTIYKVNLNKKDGTTFIGSNNYLYSDTEMGQGNNWNGNFIPGLEGLYGYNLVNISHYDIQNNKKKDFFDKPVLIKTLYFPASSKDTLNNKIVKRNYFLVSVYNEDTNTDGFINQKDLRRFYLFDSNGERQKQLVPENYSVFKSEYDPDNDFMFVFARLDRNENGQIDDNEPINIFWVDLKSPTKTGQQY